MKNLCYLLCFLPVFLLAQQHESEKDTAQKIVQIGEQVPSDALGKTLDGKSIGTVKQLPEELVILDFMDTGYLDIWISLFLSLCKSYYKKESFCKAYSL